MATSILAGCCRRRESVETWRRRNCCHNDGLCRSCILQGLVSASAGPWYAVACKVQIAKDSEGDKIKLGRYHYVFASAEISYNLWNDATKGNTDMPERLRQYMLAHELVFRFGGGMEMVMADSITSNYITIAVTNPRNLPSP